MTHGVWKKNRIIAQNRLVDKLDWHLNGEKSVEAQVKKIEKEREVIRKEKAKLKREEKALNKLRDDNSENLENESRHFRSSTESNDGQNGMEKPT